MTDFPIVNRTLSKTAKVKENASFGKEFVMRCHAHDGCMTSGFQKALSRAAEAARTARKPLPHRDVSQAGASLR